MTTPAFPEGRYGRRRAIRPRRRWALPVLVALVVGAGLLVAWNLYRTYANDPVRGQLTGFKVLSDAEVRISFEVFKDREQPATCILRARARDGEEVGRAEVPIPTGGKAEDSVRMTYTLATSRRAITGEVYGCGPGPSE